MNPLLAPLLPARAALSATLPRQLALPPGSLTHEQLQTLARLGRASLDAELERAAYAAMGRLIGGRRCPAAMAFCVARQAQLEAEVAIQRSWLTEMVAHWTAERETALSAGDGLAIEAATLMVELYTERAGAPL